MDGNKIEINDEMKEKIEVASKLLNNVADAISENTEENIKSEQIIIDGLEDFNKDGVIDKKDEKEYHKIRRFHHKDILKLFYFVYGFTFLCLIAKFVSFFCFKINIDIELAKLAATLNVAIVFIGSAEGIKSFTLSLGDKLGESTEVPAYKLKYLFGYLVAFAIITATAVGGEFALKFFIKDPSIELPNFNANDFLNGLLSNTLAYLVARYGNKVAEGIDLSSLAFFKKK